MFYLILCLAFFPQRIAPFDIDKFLYFDIVKFIFFSFIACDFVVISTIHYPIQFHKAFIREFLSFFFFLRCYGLKKKFPS